MNLELALARGGITYRQFDYWNTRGFLPWGNPGSGHSRPIHIDDRMAEVVIAMGRLVNDGFTPKRAREIAERLVDEGQVEVGGCLLRRTA
jgi:hypothetical protein